MKSKLLLVDNYDSFTFNLAQAFQVLGAEVIVRRNDKIDLDEAEAMILRALEHRPGDGYIIDSLGWVYFMRARPLLRNGRREDANEYLERARKKLYRAAELTGGDPVVSEHLGDVHLALDDKPRALEFYRQAVSLEHRAGEQPDLLDKLEGLRQELEGP